MRILITANNFIEGYLNNQIVQTLINNVVSEMKIVTEGVPQGSVIGPFLCLLNINNIQKAGLQRKYPVFGDDTNIIGLYVNDLRILRSRC